VKTVQSTNYLAECGAIASNQLGKAGSIIQKCCLMRNSKALLYKGLYWSLVHQLCNCRIFQILSPTHLCLAHF